jgi:hypothetical protein
MRNSLLLLAGLASLALSTGCTDKLNLTAQAQEPSPPTPPVRTTPTPKPSPKPEDLKAYQAYHDVIERTISMVRNPAAQALADQFDFDILNLTWEDTGRYKDSAVGPNISDMTIQVQQYNPKTGGYELNLMPVIRHPNFADESADVPLDRFYLLVGNEKGKPLERVTLKDMLGDLRKYLHTPESWKGRVSSLLADRDTHALVSAQAAFLPIPKGDKAEFNPVLFNYQSYSGDPAVLTILATREGTSVTVIDNKRDGFDAGMTWGQRLFFNKNGERASFTGQRLSDFQTETAGNSSQTPGSVEAIGQEGLNMVLLIQVPLKQRQPMRVGLGDYALAPAAPAMSSAPIARERSDVEAAAIGHGKVEGPFTEIDNLRIERDPRFPVRVTVQFYKATSNGVVSEADMQDINQQIAQVYKNADYVGSLVTSGDTGRPTEYEGSKTEPPDWWNGFWQRHEQNTGQSREEAIAMLRRLHGKNWMPRSEAELQNTLAKQTQN